MNRNEKLFDRLQSLDSKFRLLLEKELKTIVENRYSFYIARKGLYNDRFRRHDPQTNIIEGIEKKIKDLSLKLGHPLEQTGVWLVDELLTRLSGAKNRWNGGEVAIAKEFLNRLAKIDTQQNAARDATHP